MNLQLIQLSEIPQVETVLPVTEKRAESTTGQATVTWSPNECFRI